MIITKEILIELGADEESLNWLDQHNFYGLDLDTFTEEVYKESGREDWYYWCNTTLKSSRTILMVPHEFFGPYRVLSEEFSTLEEATQKANSLQEQYNKQFDYLYSVNSLTVLENRDVITTACDIYSEQPTEPGMAYEAFDHTTGLYVGFNNYTDARAYALQKKTEREALVPKQFFVEQQVREIGTDVSAWAIVV